MAYLIPSRQQFKKWAMPSKVGYIAAILTLVGVVAGYLFWRYPISAPPGRAWLLQREVKFANAKIDGVNEETVIHVAIVNSGHSPALDVETQVTAWTREVPDRETFPWKELNDERQQVLDTDPRNQSRTNVAPGGSIFVDYRLRDRGIEHLRGGGPLYVIGVVKYRDTLRGPYTTTFCYRRSEGLLLIACSKWNTSN